MVNDAIAPADAARDQTPFAQLWSRAGKLVADSLASPMTGVALTASTVTGVIGLGVVNQDTAFAKDDR